MNFINNSTNLHLFNVLGLSKSPKGVRSAQLGVLIDELFEINLWITRRKPVCNKQG